MGYDPYKFFQGNEQAADTLAAAAFFYALVFFARGLENTSQITGALILTLIAQTQLSAAQSDESPELPLQMLISPARA